MLTLKRSRLLLFSILVLSSTQTDFSDLDRFFQPLYAQYFPEQVLNLVSLKSCFFIAMGKGKSLLMSWCTTQTHMKHSVQNILSSINFTLQLLQFNQCNTVKTFFCLPQSQDMFVITIISIVQPLMHEFNDVILKYLHTYMNLRQNSSNKQKF